MPTLHRGRKDDLNKTWTFVELKDGVHIKRSFCSDGWLFPMLGRWLVLESSEDFGRKDRRKCVRFAHLRFAKRGDV